MKVSKIVNQHPEIIKFLNLDYSKIVDSKFVGDIMAFLDKMEVNISSDHKTITFFNNTKRTQQNYRKLTFNRSKMKGSKHLFRRDGIKDDSYSVKIPDDLRSFSLNKYGGFTPYSFINNLYKHIASKNKLNILYNPDTEVNISESISNVNPQNNNIAVQTSLNLESKKIGPQPFYQNLNLIIKLAKDSTFFQPLIKDIRLACRKYCEDNHL